MVNKSRQQQKNVKARKAKARDKAEREFGSYSRALAARQRREAGRSISPFAGMNMAAMASRMISSRPTEEERVAKEKFLCQVFGEEYKP